MSGAKRVTNVQLQDELVSLKDHIDERFDSSDQARDAHFKELEKKMEEKYDALDSRTRENEQDIARIDERTKVWNAVTLALSGAISAGLAWLTSRFGGQ